VFVHPRESSDNPRLNAFCRVAPSLRLRLRAIFPAGVLLRAADFNSRTSVLVQRRRFEFFLAMYGSPNPKACAYTWKCFQTKVSFVDGGNVSILYRFAENQTDRLAGPVADLVQRNATVIATAGPSAAAVNASCLAFSFLRHLGRLSFFRSSGRSAAQRSKRSFVGCPCPGKVPLEPTYGGCVRERS
jgi:hypothetical protein